MRALIDDTFLARDLAVSAPQDTLLYGEYDEELLFAVTYRSRWREVTGWPAPIGTSAYLPWQHLGWPDA